MTYAFPPGDRPGIPINGSVALFPIHRIYCVGQNYAKHAREMGADPEREPPFFFSKPADIEYELVSKQLARGEHGEIRATHVEGQVNIPADKSDS